MLPPTHVFLCNPTVPDLLSGLDSAIAQVRNNPVSHPRVLTDEDKQMLDWYFLKIRVMDSYDWSTITDRILQVYEDVMKKERVSLKQLITGMWKQGVVELDLICYFKGTFLLMIVELVVLLIMNIVW